MDSVAILLDVGHSMNFPLDGIDSNTSFSKAKDVISLIVQRKIFSKSDDQVCLFTYGSNDTANDLAEDGQYEHISMDRPLKAADWDLCNYVQNELQTTDRQGDLIDALIVASTYLLLKTSDPTDAKLKKKLAAGRKSIMVISNLDNTVGYTTKEIENVIDKFKENNVEVHIIGVDGEEDDSPPAPDAPSTSDGRGDNSDKRGDNSNGVRQRKPKTIAQVNCEGIMKMFTEQLDACSFSFREALILMTNFESKKKKSAAWNTELTISSKLKIPISGFKMVTRESLPSFKRCLRLKPAVDVERKYDTFIPDDAETEVDPEDVVKGYRYGTDIVPFTPDDENNMKYKCDSRCLDLIGFTKAANIHPHYYTGTDTMMITAQKADPTAAVALSSLIHGLYEKGAVAVVRKVYNKNSAPSIGVLVPVLQPNAEYLHYIDLAFMEDMREYEFPSLPLPGTTSAESSKAAPSEELLDSVDAMITSMEMTSNSITDDDDNEGLLMPGCLVNPTLQRLFQALSARALNPSCDIPDIPTLLAQTIDYTMSDKWTADNRANLKRLAALEKVEVKKAKKEDNIYKASDITTSDATADGKADAAGFKLTELRQGDVTDVGSANPVQDFSSLISNPALRDQGFTKMKERILQMLSDAVGDSLYEKILKALISLRTEAIKSENLDYVRVYNTTYAEISSLVKTLHPNFGVIMSKEDARLILARDLESLSKHEPWLSYFTEIRAAEDKPQAAEVTSADDDDLLDML